MACMWPPAQACCALHMRMAHALVHVSVAVPFKRRPPQADARGTRPVSIQIQKPQVDLYTFNPRRRYFRRETTRLRDSYQFSSRLCSASNLFSFDTALRLLQPLSGSLLQGVDPGEVHAQLSAGDPLQRPRARHPPAAHDLLQRHGDVALRWCGVVFVREDAGLAMQTMPQGRAG